MTRSVIRSGVYVGALWASSFAVLCATAQAADAPGNYLVFFDFNKADLTADATAIVDQAAANAAAGKVTKIEVTGYTDTVGSDAYNLRLSKRRAMSVQAELTKQGISADEIAVEGKGKHDLLVPTGDGVKEPQNRRVSIVYAVPAVAAAAPAPAAEAPAAPAAPTSNAMTTPAMSGPLTANPNPASYDLGRILGKVTVTGAVTGFAQWQDNVFPGDRSTQADLTNGQVFIQKTDGMLQYFIEAGAYSIPDLGLPYLPMSKTLQALWGPVPIAYAKFVPTDTFSVEVGKLPTLIGSEYAFTFENMNIERGLLWNQEPAVSRGIQANLTTGPVAWSVSWNDGVYSDRYNWVSGLATWTIDTSNILAVAGGGNLGHTATATYATPTAVNNEAVFDLMYTHTSGPWTISPYFQYTSVGKNAKLGYFQAADTWSFALLANYTFDADGPLGGFSLPVRAEYISSSGSLAAGAPNLLYGPGSDAFSITVTPTFQYNIYFARAEISYVSASSTTPGFALGPTFNNTEQTRVLFETGILF